MAKPKRETNIYNIDNVNMEINYDKLAEAIVEAQQKVKEHSKRPNRFRGSVMAIVNVSIPVLLAIFSVISCIGIWQEYIIEPTHGLFYCIFYTILFAVVVIISFFYSYEAWKDDDENAIMHFNTNIALVALIVAMIALLKGLG